jgi:Parvulin-like peptidyl-prolyl isomerase
MSASRLLVFNGVEIPERLVAEEAQNHQAASLEEARRLAGHALAIRALLLDRAHTLGLTPDAERDDDGREETPEEALIRAVLDAEVTSVRPDVAECRRLYDAQETRFQSPTLTEASHILCAPQADDEAGWAAAENQAKVVIAELQQAPDRFGALAKASDCPSASVGGSLGQLAAGDLAPEVEAGLARLEPGQTSTVPVRSRFGWHVLRLDRRIEGRRLPFAAVHERISTHLESRAWTAAATRYVADLAAAARETGVSLSLADDGAVSSDLLSFGDLMSDRDAVIERIEPWLDQVDGELAERVRAIASQGQESVADLVREQIAGFVRDADDERWTQLISVAQGAEDPALACVRSILHARLSPPTRSYALIRRN